MDTKTLSPGTVCVVGLGYVGLPTAAVLADSGWQVHGVDINQATVAVINRGEIHIVEPGLKELVRRVVQQGLLEASTEPRQADVFVLAVPTPVDDSRTPDMSLVHQAAGSVAPFLRPGNLVILESTSSVGTTEAVAGMIAELRPDLQVPIRRGSYSEGNRVHVAYCPERVLPGKVLRELVENDRIVGGIDQASTVEAERFYRSFVHGAVLTTDSRTAEAAKLAENAYRDTNIAFANELSILSEQIGIDVWELIDLANHHPRVEILQPGPGVGGHCIAVDPWFLIDSAPKVTPLLRCAREVNDGKPAFVADQVSRAITGLERPVIACFGLSYKPDIDDLRESAAIEVVKLLADGQAANQARLRVLVVEPHIEQLPEALEALGVELTTLDQALARADVAVYLVRHECFGALAETTHDLQVIDSCGLLQRAKVDSASLGQRRVVA